MNVGTAKNLDYYSFCHVLPLFTQVHCQRDRTMNTHVILRHRDDLHNFEYHHLICVFSTIDYPMNDQHITCIMFLEKFQIPDNSREKSWTLIFFSSKFATQTFSCLLCSQTTLCTKTEQCERVLDIYKNG